MIWNPLQIENLCPTEHDGICGVYVLKFGKIWDAFCKNSWNVPKLQFPGTFTRLHLRVKRKRLYTIYNLFITLKQLPCISRMCVLNKKTLLKGNNPTQFFKTRWINIYSRFRSTNTKKQWKGLDPEKKYSMKKLRYFLQKLRKVSSKMFFVWGSQLAITQV